MKKLFFIALLFLSSYSFGQGQQGGIISGKDNSSTIGQIKRANDALKVYDSVLNSKLAALVGGRMPVDGSGVTQPVSGTFWQAAQPVLFNDLSAAVSIAANATSSGSVTNLNGQTGCIIQLTGTFTATVQIQITTDNTNWLNITGSNIILNAQTGAYMASGNLTTVGAYAVNIAGLSGIRAITTAYTSGTVTGTVRASLGTALCGTSASPSVTIASGVITTISTVTAVTTVATVTTLSQFLAAATVADAKASGFTTSIIDYTMLYNGTNWDMQRANFNTTTGDVGAKTASFTGATQTNFNAKGATITVLCGTVTGTSPTLNTQLQWSPDVGTTWINIGAASSNITATGNTLTFMVYPTNFSVAGATPAALTTGATTTAQLNTVLPRTWRLNYTIGGTTPSFTITAVYVNYQN